MAELALNNNHSLTHSILWPSLNGEVIVIISFLANTS